MLLLFTIIDHISYQTPATGADGFKLALIPSFRSHRACRRPLALQENSHSKIISVVRKTALRASWIGKKRLSLIRTGAGANFPALLRTVMCRSSFWGAGRRSEEWKSANRPWIAMMTAMVKKLEAAPASANRRPRNGKFVPAAAPTKPAAHSLKKFLLESSFISLSFFGRSVSSNPFGPKCSLAFPSRAAPKTQPSQPRPRSPMRVL